MWELPQLNKLRKINGFDIEGIRMSYVRRNTRCLGTVLFGMCVGK